MYYLVSGASWDLVIQYSTCYQVLLSIQVQGASRKSSLFTELVSGRGGEVLTRTPSLPPTPGLPPPEVGLLFYSISLKHDIICIGHTFLALVSYKTPQYKNPLIIFDQLMVAHFCTLVQLH
jgi:hypothetical protein